MAMNADQKSARRTTAEFDAGTGELPTWGELVSEHADSVYRLAYRLAGNQQDAEDLTQDTFMRVFRSLKSSVSYTHLTLPTSDLF